MKNILLVEDEQFLANLLKTSFEKADFKIQVARDGREALKLIGESDFDLIILDLILPKMSGFELMSAIRSEPRLQKIPIIILSNLGQESDISKGKSLGAVEFYIKAQVSIEKLVENIKKILQ